MSTAPLVPVAPAVSRVFLHVGAPKTGTTFLQTLLLGSRKALRRGGVLFTADTYDRHFFAALDLQDGYFHGVPRPESRGYWASVAAEVRAWPGTSIISHEVFAAATADQVRRAVADLAPAQVHVVYTARDLGRQVPSRWQEDVKHGMTDPFETWWAAVLRRDDAHRYARWFWRTDDLTDVLDRWGATVGPERFHLITVPRSGGPEMLWSRFAQVVGFDPAVARADSAPPANQGLGVAEVELVRRVNESLGGALEPTLYGHLVKGVLAHEILAGRTGSPRLALPVEHLATVERMARGWVEELRMRGVDIVGDVEELLPVAPAEPSHPDGVAPEQIVEAGAWALAEVLLRLGRERRVHRRRVVWLRRQARSLRLLRALGDRLPGVAGERRRRGARSGLPRD